MKKINEFRNENFEKKEMVDNKLKHKIEKNPKHEIDERPKHEVEEKPIHMEIKITLYK